MRLLRESTKTVITIDDSSPLGSGGEAHIFRVVQDSTLVAKIYHQPTQARADKLAAMLTNPPEDRMAAQGHVSIAWPVDLLRAQDGRRHVVGFLMPSISDVRPLVEFYNPFVRRTQCPLFDYSYLHRTAFNLAVAVRSLHARGYVIGDVNESNILVAVSALVTLVDTD